LSASWRGGPEFRPWTPELHLLAANANLLYAANRQRAGKKTKEPLIKPPVNKPKPRRVSVGELRQRAAVLSMELSSDRG
jgi:hypothetical protein